MLDCEFARLRHVRVRHLSEQGINVPFFIKGLDNLGLVVSHPGDTHTQGIKLVFQVIQLHELTNAERSPIDGTVENEQQPVGAA